MFWIEAIFPVSSASYFSSVKATASKWLVPDSLANETLSFYRESTTQGRFKVVLRIVVEETWL